MKRRAMLKGLMAGLPAAGAILAGTTARAAGSVRQTSGQSIESCRRQLDALRERLDRSDAKTKKTLRTVMALTALSLGVDVSLLL